MRFATISSLPAVLTLPVVNTPNISEVSYLDPLLSRGIRPGPYLPDPPWPIPDPGMVGCYAVGDGASSLDVGLALIALQAKRDESCRIDDDEFHILSFSGTFNATERRCKTLHVEDSAAMSICGPAGWGFGCAEMARLFTKIYVPCREYVNDSWRLTGQMTMPDGGWLTILPTTRL